jgi:hypothetical protein
MTEQLPKDPYDRKWLERVRAHAVRQPNGCLLSKYHTNGWGYAQAGYRGKTTRVHRTLYKIVHAVDIPRKVDVCHSCDVRTCIEITHLWLGTRQENLLDASSKGRVHCQRKTHCPAGHEYTGDSLWVDKHGWRHCRICSRVKQRIASGWSHEEATANPEPIPQDAPTSRRWADRLNP